MDLFTAAASRDHALRIVADNAADWMDRAVAAIRITAEKQATITSADVWPLVPETREPRAMGAAFCRAKAEGIIARTGMSRATERANARRLLVWKSLLWHPANGWEAGNREKKAGALARALRSLDGVLASDTPLVDRAAALTPDEWAGLARIAGQNKPSDTTVLRVLEILSESERRSA